MIKGVYNENEFYTNFYWDNKFLDDLRSKLGDGAASQGMIAGLKGLDTSYWEVKEASSNDVLKQNLVQFYSTLFRALGYSAEIQDRQSSEGFSFSVFVDSKKGKDSELLAIVTDQLETGSFESVPTFFGQSQATDLKIYDQNLSDLIQEEFQDSQNPPRWFLVGAPNALFLLERGKWSFGRFIKIDWQEIFLQRDQKPYEILYGLFAKSILCPDTGKSIHDEFDDNSHRHAFEVTTELRENVREAIELLINEMIDLKKESHQKIYSEENADVYAKELTHDALYYVYRLLFLLYLEAQGDDSELLPLKSEIYRYGYSLEKLLELDFVQIQPDSAEAKGTFIYESLDKIFGLIFSGFEPGVKEGLLKRDISATGFLVKGIKSDLFDPGIIKHLKGVRLRNGTLHEILKKLSLTRPRKKERVTRVSYSNLGINQLGAVYEGLLSYSGFFAQEDLYALKPTSIKQSDIENGKELDQVYLAPKSLVEKYQKSSERKYKISDENSVLDEFGNPKIYKKGSFVYRLAGRDRQKLASYYTPESLTKCTVKYALKVLFETKKTLDQLWSLKILEPAMGSGAFLNEAVNQIADKILDLEVQSGDTLISKNVYGVDLNPTAIELARFSLWLNCIGAGKEPPSFDGRLKIGNSLIGARFEKGADGIFHWLLLDEGMLKYGKRLKDYDEDIYQKLHDFRKELLASKIESSDLKIKKIQQKAESVLHELLNQTDFSKKKLAYERLKLCGDLWCAAFFLSADDLNIYPKKHEEFCNVVTSVLEDGSIDKKLLKLIFDKYENERFFHWEIEFPEIIAAGGFDVILGNPPWLAIEWQDSLYVSDVNPVPVALEMNAAQTRNFVDELVDSRVRKLLMDEFVRLEGYSNLLESNFYSKLRGVQKNTYKAFDVLGLHLLADNAVFGVIQEDGILEDKKSATLREELYKKFRFHFQFQNEKFLFSEVGHAKRLSVNIFKNDTNDKINFDHIGNLYLPSTIDACYVHNNPTESIPLIKDIADQWETRGHSERVIKIEKNTLELFSDFLNLEANQSPLFLNLHSQPLLGVVQKIADSSETFESFLGKDNCVGCEMFHEVNSQDSGHIGPKAGYAKSVDYVVLSGPHINTANPLSQETQEIYKSKFSYDKVDLEKIPENFFPRTLYQLKISSKEADAIFPTLQNKPYRSYYRLVTRGMVNATNERCLFTAILPPMMSHINGIKGVAAVTSAKLPIIAGIAASLIQDGILRLKNKSNMFPDDILKMPIGIKKEFLNSIGRRALALNGLTSYYNELWLASVELKLNSGVIDSITEGPALIGFGDKFSRKNALRSELHREQALIEMDALTALSFDLSSEELIQVYEILFPVLNMYDRQRKFDRKTKLKKAHELFKARGW
jgi:methylase of polypeptide subunit release factors